MISIPLPTLKMNFEDTGFDPLAGSGSSISKIEELCASHRVGPAQATFDRVVNHLAASGFDVANLLATDTFMRKKFDSLAEVG